MKNKGKKILIAGLLVLAAGAVLVGCGKKKTVTFSVDGIGSYDLESIPEGTVNSSTSGDAVTVTLNKEGDYDFVLKGEDGNEYTVTIKYHDNTIEGSSEDGIGVRVGVTK
jgi:hypothetical protein